MGRRGLMAGASMAAFLFAGCGSGDDSSSASPDSLPEGAAASDVHAADGVDGSGDLTFTFSGEDGESGCSYDGPTEIGTALTSTAVNESDGEVNLSLARLAEGATTLDFLAYLDTLGDSYPVVAPPRHHEASFHTWMQGEWLELHTVPAGESQTAERSALFEGDYVSFCFRTSASAGGSEIWPAGDLTVTG